MITLNNIDKVYRTERVETLALQNINLDIAAGEFVSIMGPSGCGKIDAAEPDRAARQADQRQAARSTACTSTARATGRWRRCATRSSASSSRASISCPI